jgi:hypothetical protein
MNDISIGTVVVTPTQSIITLTPDKKYVVQDVEPDWIMIEDDAGDLRYYRTHLFLEANLYYTISMYVILNRLLNLTGKLLK